MTIAAWIAVLALVLVVMTVGGWALVERASRVAAERQAAALRAVVEAAAEAKADAADAADRAAVQANEAQAERADTADAAETAAVASQEAHALDGDVDAQVEAVRRLTGAGGAS